MSLENSVDRIIELVSDSHEKAKAKGGTTSTPYLLVNLPDAIESIPKGITPTGTKTITENGTHDVTNYASAKVEVAGEDVTTETNAYTTELAELTTAVTALEEELAGKAAGGGASLETCTVTFNHPAIESVYLMEYHANIYNNNFEYISGESININDGYASNDVMIPNPCIIKNVVCNSLLTFVFYCNSMVHGVTLNGCELVSSVRESNSLLQTVRITAKSNENATITLYDND